MKMKKTKKVLLSACVATAMIPAMVSPIVANAQDTTSPETQTIDWGSVVTKTVTITYYDVTTNQTVQSANQDVIVWKGVAYIPTAWLNVPNGYQLAEDYGLLYEIGWGYDTVSVKVKPIDEVQMAKATLNVNFEDENGVTLDYTQTFNSPDGKVGETYQFVEGENYFITLPEGYELNEEYPTVEVAYGEQETVIIQVKSQNAEQPDPGEEEKPDPGEEQPNPGDEQKPNPETPDTPSTDEEKTVENTSEESEKANDVDTAVAMPLAAAFGTMSVSLAGMVALLRRKQK